MTEDWRAQLRALRRQDGLTQAVVADLLGVDPKTVSRWERGDRRPDLARRLLLRNLARKHQGWGEADIRGLMASPLTCRMLSTADGLIVGVSDEAFRRIGIAPGDLAGRDFRQVHADPDYGRLWEEHAAAIAGGDFAYLRSRFDSRLLGWTETHSVPVWLDGRLHLLSDCVRLSDAVDWAPLLEIVPNG